MLSGAEHGGAAGKLQRLFPNWEEKWAASREWIITTGKKASTFITGEVQEVFARTRTKPTKKYPVFYPVLSWQKQELFSDRVGFLLPGKAEVYAASGGLVTELLPVKGGWRVRLDHDGEWNSFYYPLADLAVFHGQQVRAGDKLGCSVGKEYGETRLFWEVWRGGQAVPPRYFSRDRVHETGNKR